MARGKEGKLRRRNNRKQQQQEGGVTDMFGTGNDEDTNNANQVLDEVPLPPGLSGAVVEEDDSDDNGDNVENSEVNLPKKKKKKKKKDPAAAAAAAMQAAPKEKGIKTLPLIFLCLMCGTTLLPVLLYTGDYVSAFLAKNNIAGNIGFRLGLGAVPRKRVVSFYEKHAPEKLNDVPTILSKHYGDYPTLIKKLERKYQDYGYFLGWEDDEAPVRQLQETAADIYKVWLQQYWNRYAPQVLKTAARNVRYNLASLFKSGRKIWKRHVWPLLEPIVGVPDGADKQKRKDAAEARKRRAAASSAGAGGGASGSGTKTRRKNREFRDDVDQD